MGREAGTKDASQKLCKKRMGRKISVLPGQTAHISCPGENNVNDTEYSPTLDPISSTGVYIPEIFKISFMNWTKCCRMS